MPATTVAERYGKPMVTGGATLDAIWGRGYQFVNGLLPSSYDYVGVSMRLLEGWPGDTIQTFDECPDLPGRQVARRMQWPSTSARGESCLWTGT